MGFVIECEKCKRTYDTKYFIEFCPWCYVDYDKLKNQLEEALKREYEAVCGEYSAYKDLEQEYKALLKSDSLTNQMTQQSLIAALAHISKLKEAIKKINGYNFPSGMSIVNEICKEALVLDEKSSK